MDVSKAEMVFKVVGGLGIFLLGMKNMSEGMQAVAGNKMRKLINAVTNNRVMACLVGVFVTAIIQSSSITTVMVVGMVNAGLMSLVQAIGVVLGANIGTTVTAWILVLKIGAYGLPLFGGAAFIVLFTKNDRIRFAASFLMGLGMIFFGLELMKDGFAPLTEMQAFENWFHRFVPNNLFGVIKCVLAGAVLTAIVQSSSATIGITVGLASIGVIDLRTAAALILGENIGTTITAFLASLGTTTNAKRAAYAHTIVNVFGVTCMIFLFPYYFDFIDWVVNNIVKPEAERLPNVFIALAHSFFNIGMVVIMLPLIGYLSKFLTHWIPEKAHKELPHLTALDKRMFDAPAIGIEQSKKEIVKMGQMTEKMMDWLEDVITSEEPDIKTQEKIFNRENVLDVIQKEIVEFVSFLMAGNIPHDTARDARQQLRMADEYESISDYIVNILKMNLKLHDINEKISDEGKKEILQLHRAVASYLRFIDKAIVEGNTDIMNKAHTKSKIVTHLMKEFRGNHLDRVAAGQTSPLKSLIFTDILNAYRRIKDHALNIAEALAGEK